MWVQLTADNTARIMALAFCLGIFIGGSLPEFGNIVVYYALKDIAGRRAHKFNRYFLILGLCGVIICGIALYCRLLRFV